MRAKTVRITVKEKIYTRAVYVTKKGEYVNWFGKRLYLVVYQDGYPIIISHHFIDKIHTIDPRVGK